MRRLRWDLRLRILLLALSLGVVGYLAGRLCGPTLGLVEVVEFTAPEQSLPEPPPREGEMTNSIGMRLALIPPGEFVMGSAAADLEAYDIEKPQRKVRITKAFYLGVFEVTVEQFRRFVTETEYVTTAEKMPGKGAGLNGLWGRLETGHTWRKPGFRQTDRYAVGIVSWDDALAFCNWLSRKEGMTYRLPTEAEWEYACRAGSTGKYCFGDDPGTLGEYAWYADNWKGSTYVVGQKKPNAFGLYDMHGNVAEWCADFFDAHYYENSPTEDPRGPRTGTKRVFRGGSVLSERHSLRSATRFSAYPYECYFDVGFRLVREQWDGKRDRSNYSVFAVENVEEHAARSNSCGSWHPHSISCVVHLVNN